MTATVLLPLDGSEKDARALPVAAAFAELAESGVHVVRVFDTPVASLAARASVLGVTDAARELRASMESSVRDAAARLGALVPRAVTWEVIDGVDVAAALVRRAEDREAGVVVMATRAPGMVGRAVRGSVADRLMRESPRPVVLVPPGAHYLRGKHVRMRRALVPLDGSHLSLDAVRHLLDLPLARELELTLIQVVRRESDGGYMMPVAHAPTSLRAGVRSAESEWVHANAAQADRRLNEVADRLRDSGARVEVRVVESGDPGTVIVAAIRQELVDFIAMATRGAGGVKRMLHGSVATRVVRESEVPVFLVNPL